MDNFYKANNSYNASLTADYTAGDATLSVNTVPANLPSIITVARDTDFETRFTVTGASPGLLTGVTRLDGAETNISSGVSVECMIDAEYINQLESAVYTQSSLKNLMYAADGGSNDTYAITLPVAPSAYTDIIGLPIGFKANTINTGAATLNINGLGAKAIKKNFNEDLADGDLKAGQVVTVIYDGTNFQLQLAPGSVMTDSGGYLKPTTNGDDIRTYDTDGDDYLEMQHDGTDSKIATNKGHIVLTPAASKLVKTAVLRQDNTTDTYSNNQVVLTGWGFIAGTSTVPTQNENITFGVTFATPPIITMTPIGARLISDGAPTGPEYFTVGLGSADTRFTPEARGAATTGFIADIATTGGGNLTAYNYGYSWIAIGTLT